MSDKTVPTNLNLADLREANVARCVESYHAPTEWSPTDWACALAGEVGEACNLIKKLRRGELVDPAAIGEELADVLIYADLLAYCLSIDLAAAVVKKFNRRSSEIGSAHFLIGTWTMPTGDVG